MDLFEKFSEINRVDYQKVFSALTDNLSPTFSKTASKEFFEGKLETFLTCLAVSKYLKDNLLADDQKEAGEFFEEMSLRAIYKSLLGNLNYQNLRLLSKEIPNILQRDFKIVDKILESCIEWVDGYAAYMKDNLIFAYDLIWNEYHKLKEISDLLKCIKNCRKKHF